MNLIFTAFYFDVELKNFFYEYLLLKGICRILSRVTEFLGFVFTDLYLLKILVFVF